MQLIIIIIVSLGFSMLQSRSVCAKQVYRPGFSYRKVPGSVRTRMDGKSYRKNRYIKYKDLRYVQVKYYNYNGKVKTGEMIVNKSIVQDVVEIFYELFEIKYPIRRMELVDEYDADDDKSMAADNTSCFNFRIVAGTTNNLSLHALGLAIDINPKINPCVGGSQGIAPANGKRYKQRDKALCTGKYKDMMLRKGDAAYKIFIKHGFLWGGEWTRMQDYQHFYKITDGYESNMKYEW